ncbi:hypothetical protein [Bifidobacterium olomucense]|uniref:Uncharacterized protein n=1 Tax=Bifidobacterium olomucense TaxID=2675324 RepID=A0A7Y0EXD9_9BIFI|nr:hypothetical protein [Bifidobacterium sp. DSM 109959]NMM98129.1 hypothetical protein [Bifidobacterium sp. DSM 109959]
MPTHVSKEHQQLKDLGKALYAAMRSDYEYNAYATELDKSDYETIKAASESYGDSFKTEAIESVNHAGLGASDVRSVLDWVEEHADDLHYVWELTAEGMED